MMMRDNARMRWMETGDEKEMKKARLRLGRWRLKLETKHGHVPWRWFRITGVERRPIAVNLSAKL